MSATNECRFIGNLTKDPVVRDVQAKGEGTRVANLSIAVNTFRNKDKAKQETVFVDLEAWGEKASAIGRLLVKGDRIMALGEFKVDVYPHKETGENVYRTKFRMTDFEIIKAKAWSDADANPAADEAPAPSKKAAKKPARPEPEPTPEIEDEDDLPF